ncbi:MULTISPECIES: hypothetical protein [Chroococcidiopsis]|uniref:hypothetical protein n=1 Tax=Chroococcidiopsis TaxID=54298 RepID=UPI0002EE83EA|nr:MULTISPECIES: hypothetical protein [Chroococcidiopsis]MBE9020534.1 hypothetical protein [Chroococcidiopsidales cyanobacterium LEGE 13417]URD51057.1 hypothetical protein M5J74_03520 [Chroococcidiopsis sp. CCNUC1]
MTSDQLPLLTTNHQFPITDYQLPITLLIDNLPTENLPNYIYLRKILRSRNQ